MTIAHGFGLGDSHLMPDAIVAFVDNELSTTAAHRARAHLARCGTCAAEAAAQRQARNAVRALDAPGIPAGLLAALRDIPNETNLPPVPDGLAMTSDGQLVAIQRPDRAAGLLGESRVLGDSAPLGTAGGLASRAPGGKRAAQGAGVLVSGLMLGALALTTPHLAAQGPAPQQPAGRQSNVPEGNVQAAFGAVSQPASTPEANPAKDDAKKRTANRTIPAGR